MIERDEDFDDFDDFDEPDDDYYASDEDTGPVEWSEEESGQKARERWVEFYEELNGAPEGDWDR